MKDPSDIDDTTASIPHRIVTPPKPIPVVPLGTIIGGRYRLIEVLGEGGMGQVFVAENMAIGLRVAVKVLKPELMADVTFQTRFQREANAVAAIQHPNVVRFLDLVLGDPTFLVMELVKGKTLREHLKQEKAFPARRAVAIAERLAGALAAVHAAGIVHRDLKPANVLLASDQESELSPKIIDFGVVRFAAASTGLHLTKTGQFVGTLHYMAPEQISSGAVDARADLYALGSVLYHMLVGKPPFGDALDEAQALHDILERKPPPAAPDGRLPKSLVALLDALLAKKASLRPPTASAVAFELRGILAQLDSDVTEPIRRAPPIATWRTGIAGSIALALLVGGGGYFAGTRRQRSTAPVAAAATNKGAMLAVGSEPRGARVEIDGRALDETTPTAVRGLTAGRHRLRVSLEGHTPVEETVELGPGARELVQVAIPPASREVLLQTKPPDATVLLNNQILIQHTPVKLQLLDDEFYELRIEKPGYEPLQSRVTPEQREPTISLSLQPEQEARGDVVVESYATGRVFVDGFDTGFKTPSGAISVVIGEHTVQVHYGDGSESPAKRIAIKAGETLHLSLDPDKQRKRR